VFPIDYFGARYYAPRYWPEIGAAVVVIGATPDARTAYVGSEVRAARVLSDVRSAFIPPDDRIARVRL
jgi:hypothetical protein